MIARTTAVWTLKHHVRYMMSGNEYPEGFVPHASGPSLLFELVYGTACGADPKTSPHQQLTTTSNIRGS